MPYLRYTLKLQTTEKYKITEKINYSSELQTTRPQRLSVALAGVVEKYGITKLDRRLKQLYADTQMSEKNPDIIYKDLSYKIIGIAYNIFNELGPGHKEKYYQNAFALAFKNENIKFQRETYTPLIFNNKVIGKYFLDFEIEEKIVLEIKRGERISRRDIEQLYTYLKSKNLKLGLLIRFTEQGAIAKRIVNLK
jgi:GxxExxY protein